MPQRLYLGRLSAEATQADVQKLFENYGRLLECRVMTGFGFVEFENSRDAEDVVTEFNGKQFMGQPIIVEFARENRRRGGDFERPRRDDRERRGPPLGRRPPGFRIFISGLSRDTSWQDLKDFGREAGNVCFADVDRDYPGTGILEYVSQDDADYAVRKLDNRELRGVPVRVEVDRGGSWRDSARGRDREDRYRDRSPGPARGDDYRRRSRSPRAAPRREDREEDFARKEDYRREKEPREYERRY